MFKATEKFTRRYKRKKTSSKNTFEALRPIKFLSHIAGFRVFEYPQGHYRPIQSFIYTMLLCTFYYMGWYFQGFVEKMGGKYDLQEAIYQMTNTFNHIGMFVMLIVGCYQSKSLNQSVRRIHEVDVTLRALGSPGNFDAIYKKMIGILTFLFLVIIIYVILNIGVHMLTFPNTYTVVTLTSALFMRLYSQIVEYVLITEFFMIVSCIESEFQRVNDLLGDINVLPLSSIAMELLDYKNSKDSFSTNKFLVEASSKLFTIIPSSQRLRSHLQMTSHEIIRTRRLLQTIRQVHLELYRVSKRISMIYGIQTAIEMSLCVLYTTYFIYIFYDTYQHETENSIIFIGSITVTSVMSLNNLLKIFSINYICDRTSHKVQQTSEIIYTFYGQSTDSELQEEMEMFCLQMMHCRLVYSAAGLYSLNYKTICGCVGAITTYAVIMIQVTNSILEETS